MTSDSRWDPEDPRSRALLALAAGERLPVDVRVEGGLVELSRRHGLTSLLAQESTSPLVRAVHARQQARQAVMLSESVRILRRLSEAGVRTSVIKGPAVADYYANRQVRPYSDLDYLVEEADLDIALETLRTDEFVVEIPPRGPKAAKRDVVVAGPTGVRFNLDLHWDLFSYSQFRDRTRGAIAEGWQDATFVEDDLGPRWILPQPYEIAFLTAHAVLDHRFRMILFRDLLEVARGGDVDWSHLHQVASSWGLRSTTYLAFWIARGALGAEVPTAFLDEIRPRSLALTYLESAIPQLDLLRFDGHKAHPVNLASVLLADAPSDRFALAIRAPRAFPKWRKRVTDEHEEDGERLPRVLIVVSTNRRRGAEVFTERLQNGLTSRGWVVDSVALRGSSLGSRAKLDYLVSEEETSGARFEWRVFRRLRATLKSYRPDVIVANGGATLRYSLAARIGTRIDVAYMSIGEPDYWIRSPVSKTVNRFMLRRVDKILAVSEATRSQLISLEPTTKEKTVTVYTGLTHDLFNVRRSDHEGPLRLVMVGSLTPEKDPNLGLETLTMLDDAVLRFVGDGPLLGDLEQSVQAMNVTDRVEFVGSVEDVSPHLEWGDVLVLTSWTEGLPGAILEASAASLPVVAVDVGGVAEAVQDGVTGFVTPRDARALSDAIARLDRDRELLRSMGSSGRRLVKERFQIGDVVENYRQALKDLGR